ncbi:MAG: hypothetical protein GWN93_06745 [Deltaproteobacteria bacterium]|nr:hypothetical protein [Deltaproteobacteria bacterium]
MAVKRCVVEHVKLTDLLAYLRKHKLRIVRLERWDKRGLLLVTDYANAD